MAILAFQRPDRVLMLKADSSFGKFEFRPLEPGYGTTIGNTLRRILLSSLEGFAVTFIKIDRVDHEFGIIPGVIENMTNIILNLKQVRLKHIVDNIKNEKMSIVVSGSKVFKASDISKQPTGFEILNPDLVICRLDPTASSQIELIINKGRGYASADKNRNPNADIHVIIIDSIFTPVRSVKYSAENFRIEQKTGYEKLVLEVAIDGSIHPKEALKEVTKILIHHFMLFSDKKIAIETADTEDNEEFDEGVLRTHQLPKNKLTDTDLPVCALNCLKVADIETPGESVKLNKNDLLKFRNFGKKSLTELDELLEGLNLSFGVDITKYKLDKE